MENLLYKIVEKEAVICIVGLGYTGLSLAHDFGKEGFKIIGFDIDTTKIEKLQKQESYLPFLPLGHLFNLIEEKKLVPTSNPLDLEEADIFIISVPTPLNDLRLPDISSIQKASLTVAQVIKKSKRSSPLVVIQSTTYPGTTDEEVLPILEKETGLKVGVDLFLAYVPEREDPGNPNVILTHVPRLCGGITHQCLVLAKALYENITDKVLACSSTKAAEATKIYENTFRLINISFVNEMKMVFDQMGIDIWEVIEAASTKPFGFSPFYPGPGVGGECIPVDPIYLSWRAQQFDAATTMIDNASRINLLAAEYTVHKISDALKENHKTLESTKILILGVAFKRDVNDIRESPALRVMQLLIQKGAKISYHDFFVPYLNAFQFSSVDLTKEVLAESDCVAILTDHSRYDMAWICENSALIIDSRNATKHLDNRLKKKIRL